MKSIDKILKEETDELKNTDDAKERFKILSKELFILSFSSVARGLMVADKYAYAARLAQIALNELGGLVYGGERLTLEEMDFLTKGSSKHVVRPGSYTDKLGLTTVQKKELGNMLGLKSFAGLDSHLSSKTGQWAEWIRNLSVSEEQKSVLPIHGWESSQSKELIAFQHLLVVKCFRPDLVSVAVREFVTSVFGDSFLDCIATIDLNVIVKEENSKNGIEPFLLISLPGYDSSAQVELLVQTREMGAKFEALAMGSPEGYPIAEAAIKKSAKEGTWLFLKNVHLSSAWLAKVERDLSLMKNVNKKFTLFLSMEHNDKVPSNLIRMSNCIIFEPPVGLKPALIRSFSTLVPEVVNKAPKVRARLQFLLTWLHSIVLERLRYTPVGWTKGFEFGASDLRCGVNAVNEWVDKSAGQHNGQLTVNQIPWDALQALCAKVLYGGRIDNIFDQARLDAFVKSVMVKQSFDKNFALCNAWDDKAKKLVPLIKMPDASSFDEFKAFIDGLPDIQSPELLGLPSNADVLLATRFGSNVLHTLEICVLADASTGDEAQDVSGSDDAQTRAKKKKRKKK